MIIRYNTNSVLLRHEAVFSFLSVQISHIMWDAIVNVKYTFYSNNFSFQFIIGTGDNFSDFTYHENVAHAHICAEEALDFQTVSVAGKVHRYI